MSRINTHKSLAAKVLDAAVEESHEKGVDVLTREDVAQALESLEKDARLDLLLDLVLPRREVTTERRSLSGIARRSLSTPAH